MKRILLLTLAALALLPSGYAEGRKKKSSGETTTQVVVDDKEIHWMNIDDVQVAMKKQPKMVWIDVYTDWCGWCKRMDKTTFSNPNVIRYMNEHFYAVKLDAEQKGEIRFMGKMYPFVEGQRANSFATELLQGQMSYPTSVFMEPGFQNPQPIPGYQDVKNIEMILKYLAQGLYKKTPFEQYAAAFQPTWL